jgi:hypothetical protein
MPIHMVCENGDEEVIKFLLNHGSSIDPPTIVGHLSFVFKINDLHLGWLDTTLHCYLEGIS